MDTEKKQFFNSLIGVFIYSLIVLSILTFFGLKPEKLIDRVIIVIIGSIIFSIIFCILWIISTKLIKPKALRYFVNHKNLKQLEELGLKFNEKINGYSGTIEDYELTICCNFGEFGLFTTEYVINIFFEPENVETIRKIRKKELHGRTVIAECVIQEHFSFKFFPPSYINIKRKIEMLIEPLKRNNLKPISTEELEKKINVA